MIYFILFAILLICIYAYDYRKHRSTELFAYILVCIFFIGIVSLRYRIGGDSIGYEGEYRNIPSLGNLTRATFSSFRYEPGYILFCSLAKTVSSDFTFFQFLHALIVNGVIFWFVYKNTQNKFIAITLYYICLYLNLNTEVLREALAVCCFLLAWPFFRDNKWWYYFPLAALSTTFHISGFITFLLPIAAVPGIRQCFLLGKRTILICLALFVVCLIVQRRFYGIIQLLASNSSIEERAQTYAKSTSFGGMSLNIVGMMENLLRNVIIPAAAVYFLKCKYSIEKKSKEFKQFRKEEILIVTGIYFAVITLVLFIAGRFNNYIGMFNYIAIASCIFTKFEKKRRKIRISGALWSLVFSVVLIVNFKPYFAGTYGSDSHKRYMVYYPYYSRLDPQDDADREEIIRYFHHMK